MIDCRLSLGLDDFRVGSMRKVSNRVICSGSDGRPKSMLSGFFLQ